MPAVPALTTTCEGGIAPAGAARGIRQRPVPDAPLGRACGYARLIGLPCARTKIDAERAGTPAAIRGERF